MMSFRLAAYAVTVEMDKVLLVLHAPTGSWTLPGGGVEHGEDPFETVTRELHEETGCHGVVEGLLGVDSRVIPASERLREGPEHHNVGVFYRVRLIDDVLQPASDEDTGKCEWTDLEEVASRPRSSLVDIGLGLHGSEPVTGHVPPVRVGGLIRH